MKTGTEDIKHLILRSLRKYNVRLNGIKYGAYADELAEQLFELIGDDMGKRDWSLVHGIPADIEKFIRHMERALGGYMFKRDDNSLEVYKWIMAQPETKLKAFIEWATAPERIQFIGKYRNNPATIQFDWDRSLTNSADKRTSLLETIT